MEHGASGKYCVLVQNHAYSVHFYGTGIEQTSGLNQAGGIGITDCTSCLVSGVQFSGDSGTPGPAIALGGGPATSPRGFVAEGINVIGGFASAINDAQSGIVQCQPRGAGAAL